MSDSINLIAGLEAEIKKLRQRAKLVPKHERSSAAADIELRARAFRRGYREGLREALIRMEHLLRQA